MIEKQVCSKNARTGPDGKSYMVDYYNLDVVIAVGYRVKSPNATVFRKWATNETYWESKLFYKAKGFVETELNILEKNI